MTTDHAGDGGGLRYDCRHRRTSRTNRLRRDRPERRESRVLPGRSAGASTTFASRSEPAAAVERLPGFPVFGLPAVAIGGVPASVVAVEAERSDGAWSGRSQMTIRLSHAPISATRDLGFVEVGAARLAVAGDADLVLDRPRGCHQRARLHAPFVAHGSPAAGATTSTRQGAV
ncbi:hypothetical protein [Micromonospora coerulea]|uniref:hypothetical protein n=1 Tax=Micromonospora coerulea TaxID=47856 RepID=UPI001905C169|nr:hypothetical protein [Micromonospora veneta]